MRKAEGIRMDEESAGPLRRAEDELRRARAQLEVLADAIPSCVARCSRDRRFVWVNRRYADRLGRSPEELAGQSLREALGDLAYRVLEPYIERALDGQTVDFECEIAYPGLDPGWIQATYAPTRDPSGAIDGWIAVVTDVSSRKAIQQALGRRAAELEAIYETAPVGIMVGEDPECRVITANRALAEMLKMPFGENISKSSVDAEHLTYTVWKDGEVVPAEQLPMQRAAILGIEVRDEVFDVLRGDGSRITVLVNASPVRDGSGAITGAVGIAADITCLRAAEEARRESEQRFARFMQHLPGLAWIKDRAGRYVYANDFAVSAFQVRREALYGKTDDDVFPPVTAAQFRENDRQALVASTGMQTVELLEHSDGIVHHSLVSKFPIPGPDGAPAWIGGMAIDITERLQAADSLRASERRFRFALSNGAVTVFEQDLDLRYTWAYTHDPAFPQQVLGRTDLELLPEGGGPELTCLKRQVIESGRGARRTVRVSLPAGVRYYDLLVEPRHDGTGQIVGVGGALLDVTAQKLVEESLKDAGRRKDEFLATLAHELRNPLAPIANSMELLRFFGPRDPDTQEAHDIIDRQVRQLTRLVDDLLDVARVSRGKINLRRRLIDLASVVEQAVETSRPLIAAAGHELVVSLPTVPLLVEGDLTRLAQAIGNLLNNAAKYINGPGRITLEATREDHWARIAVLDSGIGISPGDLTRIFDLFAQVETGADRAHGGLGIGLTLVKSLLALHGGTVEAQSDGPGRGSTLIVRLPLAALPPPGEGSGSHDERATHPVSSRCRILIVDDNVDAAESLARLLHRAGNDVVTAHDGRAALQTAASSRPDLMLVDLGMPGMSGYDVARRIRQEPELAETCLVAVTGWGQPEDWARARDAGFDHHLVKPVDFGTLRSLLNRRAEARHAPAGSLGKGL
jgi:PAS domain S-box-containing protein